MTALDRLHTLFENTFGHGFEPLGAGPQAFRLSEPRRQTRGVDDADAGAVRARHRRLPRSPGCSTRPAAISWATSICCGCGTCWMRDSDTITLGDGSEAAVMLARTLVLECPRGQTGRESITSDGPTRLPEARRAIQSGKLPRKVGLTLVRHDHQYELTLQAETLAVSGARLPAPEASEERARLEERMTQLRHLLETLDLLYDAFSVKRAGDQWAKELAKMQKWLERDERGRSSAAS